MPTQSAQPSPHQNFVRAHREEQQRARQWDAIADEQKRDTDQVDVLQKAAARLESGIRTYDTDEQHRQRVAEDRAAARAWTIVLVFMAIITVTDIFFVTPDAAGYLADRAMTFNPAAWKQVDSKAATDASQPLATATTTPVWVRLLAGGIVVAAFIGLTLGVKKVADERELQEARFAVSPGDHQTYNRLTRAIWSRRAMKVGWMCVLAGALVTFYEFDQQRNQLTVSLAKEDKQANASSMPPVMLGTDGSIVTSKPQTPEAESAEDQIKKVSAAGLSKATAVVFCAIWLLHGLLLLLPNGDIGRPLEYANFVRSKVEAKAIALREQEAPIARRMVERIFTAPEGPQRQQLVRIAEPVAHRINAIYGRPIIDGGDDSAAPSPATATPPPANPPSAVAAVASNPTGDTDAQPGSFVPETDWNSIFPSQSPA